LKRLHYGWVMTIVSSLVLATNALIFYSFGLFLIPITTEFNWERGALSAALSINMVTAGFIGILAGRLSDRYGPRFLVTAGGIFTGAGFILLSQISSLWQAFLVWGLLLAIGGSESFIPIMSTIPRWFSERRGIAVGLTVTGFGLGGIIAPILAQWLISSYGWRQAYMALGILMAIIIIPLAQFMKHSPQRMGLKPYGEMETVADESTAVSLMKGLSLRQTLKTGRFWIFGLVQLCFLFCIQVVMAHIAPHAVDIGISVSVAASIISIFAATSLIGRNLVGFISDKMGAGLALTAFLVIVTASLIWLFFSQDTWMFYLFAVIYGIAYGGVVPLQTLVTGELFGLKSLGIILAILMLFSTLGGALGAPLAGYIFDTTASYRLAFIICILLCALAFVLSLGLLRSTRQAKHKVD